MVARRLKPVPRVEYVARALALGFALGLPLAALGMRALGAGTHRAAPAIELRARAAEQGGWSPANLTVLAGQPLQLRLTSEDMLHGFAVGQTDMPALDVPPGQVVETSLTFEQPGRYVFYCTRWCGLGHWRMRGTIEVAGEGGSSGVVEPPLYLRLGLDIDAPRPAVSAPGDPPSAQRGALLGQALPAKYASRDYYLVTSPAQAWQDLHAEAWARGLTDEQAWDLVAWVWQSNTTRQALAEGRQLYAANCAACHGELGAGDGVMAEALANNEDHAQVEFGHGTRPPAKFTDPGSMLGASPSVLHGKILRGGMGTGMPYWGPIFTEGQIWDLVDYLWTFVFQYEELS